MVALFVRGKCTILLFINAKYSSSSFIMLSEQTCTIKILHCKYLHPYLKFLMCLFFMLSGKFLNIDTRTLHK